MAPRGESGSRFSTICSHCSQYKSSSMYHLLIVFHLFPPLEAVSIALIMKCSGLAITVCLKMDECRSISSILLWPLLSRPFLQDSDDRLSFHTFSDSSMFPPSRRHFELFGSRPPFLIVSSWIAIQGTYRGVSGLLYHLKSAMTR